MDLAELEVADRIDADEQHIGVGGMKGDEVAQIGLEPADLLAAWIERMDEADLVALRAHSADVSRVVRGRRGGYRHLRVPMRASMICGSVFAKSHGSTATQRA